MSGAIYADKAKEAEKKEEAEFAKIKSTIDETNETFTPSGRSLRVAIANANKFARLHEEQRARLLEKHFVACGVFQYMDVPDRAKQTGGGKKKKRGIEDMLDNESNQRFLEFVSYYNEIKRNAEENMVQEAIDALHKYKEFAVVEDGELDEMQKNLTEIGNCLNGVDMASIQIFLKLYKQFAIWLRRFMKEGEDAGQDRTQNLEKARELVKKYTRFEYKYLKKMSELVRLVNAYPRLMYAGTTRDIMLHHAELFRAYVVKHKEEDFWKVKLNHSYLIGCALAGEVPKKYIEDRAVGDALEKANDNSYIEDEMFEESLNALFNMEFMKDAVQGFDAEAREAAAEMYAAREKKGRVDDFDMEEDEDDDDESGEDVEAVVARDGQERSEKEPVQVRRTGGGYTFKNKK